MLVKREEYLAKLRQLKDKRIIKVITGVRRSGKSTLLELFKRELLELGTMGEQVQSYNFEDMGLTVDVTKLHQEIRRRLVPNQKNYIFLDEIQNIKDWEKLADSLFIRDDVDLYLTGSNAFMLSGELATLLSGRYIEVSILPLSFKEYLELHNDKTDLTNKFADYMWNGGFPQSFEMFEQSAQLGVDYLRGIYTTIILKDVVTRDGADDAEALENILKFAFQNIGSLVSPNKIADYMKANYRTIDPRKVERLLSVSKDGFILYAVDRFDIKGKELLQTQQKYYLVDTGLRRVLLGQSTSQDTGHILENVVYLELLRRGYQVWTGKTKSGKEVDFVARNYEGELEYYQVTETMRGDETRKRELAALNNIDDHNRKYIITLDAGKQNHNGIQQINAVDWLLMAQISPHAI